MVSDRTNDHWSVDPIQLQCLNCLYSVLRDQISDYKFISSDQGIQVSRTQGYKE